MVLYSTHVTANTNTPDRSSKINTDNRAYHKRRAVIPVHITTYAPAAITLTLAPKNRTQPTSRSLDRQVLHNSNSHPLVYHQSKPSLDLSLQPYQIATRLPKSYLRTQCVRTRTSRWFLTSQPLSTDVSSSDKRSSRESRSTSLIHSLSSTTLGLQNRQCHCSRTNQLHIVLKATLLD
jgi:hypothetical protein